MDNQATSEKQTSGSRSLKSLLILLRRLWPIFLAIATGLVVLLQFDWIIVAQALSGMPLGMAFLKTGLLTFGIFAVCALRWIAVTGLSFSFATVRDVYVYTAVVLGVATATPFQFGEALKIKFANSSGLQLTGSIRSFVVERLFDLAGLIGLIFGGLTYRHFASNILAGLATIAPIVGFGLILHLLYLAHWRQNETRFTATMNSIFGLEISFARITIVVICTIAKWLLTAIVWIIFVGLSGINIEVFDGMLLVGSVSAVSIFSLVPAGVGVQELSTRAFLIAIGADPSQADVASITLRLFTLLLLAIGICHLPFLSGMGSYIVKVFCKIKNRRR